MTAEANEVLLPHRRFGLMEGSSPCTQRFRMSWPHSSAAGRTNPLFQLPNFSSPVKQQVAKMALPFSSAFQRFLPDSRPLSSFCESLFLENLSPSFLLFPRDVCISYLRCPCQFYNQGLSLYRTWGTVPLKCNHQR